MITSRREVVEVVSGESTRGEHWRRQVYAKAASLRSFFNAGHSADLPVLTFRRLL